MPISKKMEKLVSIELLNESHVDEVYRLIDENREHIYKWFMWVPNMQSAEDFRQFLLGSNQRVAEGIEHPFVIKYGDEVVGRTGIYRIDPQNKCGMIGYWISEAFQGKGIMTESTKQVLDYGFKEAGMHRIEIRCGSENLRSKAIPERLGLHFEGIAREAEWNHGRYIDLLVYSMLAGEWGN